MAEEKPYVIPFDWLAANDHAERHELILCSCGQHSELCWNVIELDDAFGTALNGEPTGLVVIPIRCAHCARVTFMAWREPWSLRITTVLPDRPSAAWPTRPRHGMP